MGSFPLSPSDGYCRKKLHENINWVEYLKLRASIGLVGNNQNENGRYLFDQTYSSNGSYF